MTVNMVTIDIPICTFLRVFSGLLFDFENSSINSSFLSFTPRKSTEKEVVNEVKAESALEYAAAINPNKNSIPINGPTPSLKAMDENNKSELAYVISGCKSAYIYSNAPKNRKTKFTAVKRKAMEIMFF